MFFASDFRSMLFTPAPRLDQLAKAVHSGTHICIIDLESSISPNMKNAARAMLSQCLATEHPGNVAFAVRINALGSSEGVEDLLAVKQGIARPDYLVIPKIESAREVRIIEQLLGEDGKSIRFVVLVETPDGVANVKEIAGSSSRLMGLMFGAADYTRSVGAEITWDSLLFPRAQIVNAARGAGIEAIDTPYFNISDEHGLLADTLKVRQLGYTGRAAIHPSQVKCINETFRPSPAMIERAKKIVLAADNNAGNICTVDGMMVGIPIVQAARRLLSHADGGHRELVET